MPSIKLGQLLSAANHFLGGARGITAHPKQAAVDLLKKNPLELDHSKSPTAHLTRNPLEFQHIQFPEDLGADGGHYMIFYSISNNKSLTADKEFNDKIGVSIDSEDIKKPEAAVGRQVVIQKQNKKTHKYSSKGILLDRAVAVKLR